MKVFNEILYRWKIKEVSIYIVGNQITKVNIKLRVHKLKLN